MTVKSCPHCNSEIPAGMEVMPVCVMCGGDINAAPTQTWATLDISSKKTYECPECHTEIKSVLTTECPNCHAELQLAAQATPDQVAAHGPPPDLVPEPVAPIPVAPEPTVPAFAAPEPLAPPAFTPPEPVSRKPAPPVKEGFFDKLLRILGFKK